MILIILVACIFLFFCGLVIENVSGSWSTANSVGGAMQVIFGILSGIALCVLVGLICCAANDTTIDERLAMYQDENAKIEQQIDILVKDYQEYESGVFADASSESAITLVSLYPELKADQLVSSQLDIYVQNNEMIKSLKLEKINADVVRWWLYFGGK